MFAFGTLLMKKVLPVLAISVLVFLADRIACSENLMLGINGEDDRVLFSNQGSPWDAIGQVNISGYRRITRCTGTLVASDRVITAAHCLIDQKTQQKWPLNTIHFVAAVRNGQNKGHATAKCLKFMKDFDYGTQKEKNKLSFNDLNNDAALIILSHSFEVPPVSLAENVLVTVGQPFLHVAYPAERRFIPSAHLNCHLVQKDLNSGLWSTDCDSSPASSGGPLFLLTENKHQLAAIMVGAGKYNYALPSAAWKHLIFEDSCS